MHFENWPERARTSFWRIPCGADRLRARCGLPGGHHGNAVLSRFPLEHYREPGRLGGWRKQKRGCYTAASRPALDFPIHVGCVQLGLREAHRQAQLQMLADWTNALPEGEPVVVAGDFNDWRQRADHPLKVHAGLEEIFTAHAVAARTFPVRFPCCALTAST
ncbi:endonuclease/exonuclease/phosphatase family protein [Shigella flexneri]